MRRYGVDVDLNQEDRPVGLELAPHSEREHHPAKCLILPVIGPAGNELVEVVEAMRERTNDPGVLDSLERLDERVARHSRLVEDDLANVLPVPVADAN